MRKPLSSVTVFFIIFLAFLLLCWEVFPTDVSTNTVIVPGWYPVVAITTATVVAIVYKNSPKTKDKRERYLLYKAGKKRDRTDLRVGTPSATKIVNADYKEPEIPAELRETIRIIFATGDTNVNIIRRRLNIGYARAATIIDKLEKYGIVGEFQGSAPREILVRDEALAVRLVAGEIARETRSCEIQEPVSNQPIYTNQRYATPVGEHLWQAILFVIETGDTSPLRLAGALRMSYSDAFDTLEKLGELGIVGEYNGSTPRALNVGTLGAATTLLAAHGLTPPRIMGTRTIGDVRSGTDETAIIRQSMEYLSAANAVPDEDEWRWLQTGLSRKEYELRKTDGMDGHIFESWCSKLLRDNGFINVAVTKGSGDQGVDVLAEKGGVKYAVQCKCYSRDLGNKPVQEVNAGKTFYGCHVGVVMTNARFTSGAKELAKVTGVLLWDRDTIKEMIKPKS